MKRSNNDNTAFASPYDSPHISSATGTDGAEAKNQARTKQLDWIRIGLATLTLAVSVAVVGCTGDTIHAYYWTQPGPRWHLRLIPARLDLRPTTALLASSSLIAFTSLAYIVVAMLSIIRRRPTPLNVLSTVTAVAGLIFSVVGLAYAQILTRRFRAGREHNGTTTFVAWACKWSRQGVPAPAIFKTVCKEGRAVVVLMGVVIGLEVLALAVCAWGWSIEAKVKKARRESVAVKGDERL